MLFSGGFGFQHGTVFGVLNWGLLDLKKGSFFGSQKWAPMNAALLKDSGSRAPEFPNQVPKNGAQKRDPKWDP